MRYESDYQDENEDFCHSHEGVAQSVMSRRQTMKRDFAVITIFELIDELRVLILVVLVADVDLREDQPANVYEQDYPRKDGLA